MGIAASAAVKAVASEDWKAEQRKKQLEKNKQFLQTKRGQKMMRSRHMRRYMKKREEKLAEGAALRQRQEQDTAKGERVWFSRHVENGRLRHWVLLTYNTKYELRRAANGGDGKFTFSSRPFTIDQEQRQAFAADWKMPEADGYFVCLIGWTRMSKEQVDAACQQTFKEFPEYNLFWNNCQHFLKNMAERILVAHAADYSWFADNVKTKYHKDTLLQPPPLEHLMRMQQRMQQMQAQNQMQNQINMQNMQNQMQIQMQNQINMQIQSQIQNQMQMQMMNQVAMQAGAVGGGGA